MDFLSIIFNELNYKFDSDQGTTQNRQPISSVADDVESHWQMSRLSNLKSEWVVTMFFTVIDQLPQAVQLPAVDRAFKTSRVERPERSSFCTITATNA
jgi:hypothetical protein